MKTKQIAIIGGGAAGFFAAIKAAEESALKNKNYQIHLFEAASTSLRKVSISGGGRCNLSHNNFDPRTFCEAYPRGKRELLAPYHQFQASDTVEWFEARGVEVVAERDGRMFPKANHSQFVVNCLLREAEKKGVICHNSYKLASIAKTNDLFQLQFTNQEEFEVDIVMLATGSSPSGYKFANSLGHKISDLAPSLFSFKINSKLIQNLPGLSFDFARLQLKTQAKKKFKQAGPLLITHWGLSGPAILKLSAWAAREMQAMKYKTTLTVNWLGLDNVEEYIEILEVCKMENSKKNIANFAPEAIAKRFWSSLILFCSIDPEKKWIELAKKDLRKIAELLFATQFEVLGKNRFKEEFVECGGVVLKEVNFKTMESKVCNNLYFGGELLDIDGITGGFNLQSAWTTGWIAGKHMV